MNKELIENILKECEVELYDTETTTENEKKIFRVFIVSKDGVNIDKCAQVSRVLSPIFDLDPPVSGEYFLEVSSPGLERSLKTKDHFVKSIGCDVKIKLTSGDKVIGLLKDVINDTLILEVNNEEVKIDFLDIEKARTYYQW